MEKTRRTLQQYREAIRRNEVAFPSPAPQFPCQCRPEIQWRVAELFLIHGWTCARLADRYGVTRGRIWWFVRTWIDRALALGYLQDIPPADTRVASANHVTPMSLATPTLPVQWPPAPSVPHQIHAS